ncbi:MAG: tRNA (adenosine(37)-N6)-threonylcarbamoyltransferase complex dimerization subunit type 1 TsaB [Desulfobulbaceae bacterium]
MDGLLILGIETASTCGSVSLSRGTGENFRLLTETMISPPVSHSRRLLGSLQWVMDSAGIDWAELDGVAVSIGPGSFTGLRIGLAAAKGVVMAAGKPLVGVPTLSALALTCAGTAAGRLTGALLDARKKEVYAAFHRFSEEGMPVEQGGPMVIAPEKIPAMADEPVLLAGPGVSAYREVFEGHEHLALLPDHLGLPRASLVAMLGSRMLARGETMDPVTAAPLYVRASEAELNLRAKKHTHSAH